MERTDSLQAGDELGRYSLTRRLGRGAMAEVWEAEGPDGTVALKIPRRPSFLRHLRREGLYLAEIDHPNVARFIEADLEGETPFLAMEFVDGRSLRSLCRGTMSPQQVTLLSDQILDGLEAIHSTGILHLDLKPENVLVTESGAIKIVDLGLGRATTAVMAELYLSVSLVSRELPIAGTLAYMAPEQRKGRPVDRRTDLFAFGVLLHELLSGQLPDPSVRLSKLRPDISLRWDVTIGRLTHPNPDKRPRDADAARRLVSFTLAQKLQMPVARGGRDPRELKTFDEEAFELASPWSPGMVIGDCTLETLLGRGGYGEVWRARRGEEEVALKVALHDAAIQALSKEARISSRFDHPGIPRVLADRTEADPPHVVFELIKGTSLRLRIHEEEPIPVVEGLEIFRRMVEVVAACHEEGIVHRDLKPEHFVVDGETDRVYLIDFGLAHMARKPGVDHSFVTETNIAGTFDYMAPEQKKGFTVGRAADIYALGVCLFEILADDLPRGPQRLQMLRPEVPHVIDRLTLEMLQTEPQARPGISRILRSIDRGLGERRPETAGEQEMAMAASVRKKWAVRLVGLLVCFVIGLAVLGPLYHGDSKVERAISHYCERSDFARNRPVGLDAVLAYREQAIGPLLARLRMVRTGMTAVGLIRALEALAVKFDMKGHPNLPTDTILSRSQIRVAVIKTLEFWKKRGYEA